MKSQTPPLVIACLPLALLACDSKPAAAPETVVAAAPPLTAVAQPAPDAPLATVPALVSLPPAARVAVTAPFSGAVRQIHVVEGQEVKAGQLLATVISREALVLASDKARADARLALARANAERIGQLAQEGVVAGARADEARAALREAQVSQSETARILARGGASADGVVRLVAPIAGRVSKVGVETGGPLDGMTAPFVIDGSNRYALSLQLPERLAGTVKPGMAVMLPGGGRGSILSVAPGLDPQTRSVNAIASVGAAPGLLAGGSVMATIVGGTSAGAVSVPSAAVTQLDGRDVVFVRGKDGFSPVAVAISGAAEGTTIIAQGLADGAVVAVSGLPELKQQAER